MSPDFPPPARCDVSHAREEKRPLSRVFFDKGRSPFSRGENRISQGVENRGSLISVPLALRESVSHYPQFGPATVAPEIRHYPPPQKKLLTQKNPWGIIFGVIATVSRSQLRKKILWEIFSRELRKFRVAQHGRVRGLCGRQLRKIILGELISW